MPRDQNGIYSLPAGYKAVSGQKVLASQHNPPLEDLASSMTNSLPRTGVAPMTAALPMGGNPITGMADGSNDQDAVTMAQLTAAITNLTTPTGQVGYFMRKTAPSGWVEANGGTVGSSSSGATTRANADTIDLFTVLWTDFSDTELPIQTSAGSASTRGSTAAADFAASKRLTVHNLQGEFVRGWDHGRGVDGSRSLGSFQDQAFKSHTHTGSAGSAGAHTHSAPAYGGDTGGAKPYFRATGGSSQTLTTSSAGAHTHPISIDATGGAETRPRNVSALVCLKL